ncbi:hypothetical protein JMJ55_22390 [Belnapia sp. T6]|uniref:Uncharacterized protein n=1 Tax=Belnapia mucosa TaxID=2804532 RepID=A0ABS1V8W0_9PROT|nr:hypothetical protein [Belnapia mucosa]MBL6458090.1 hypothetical protein [Belnapia mucosa]
MTKRALLLGLAAFAAGPAEAEERRRRRRTRAPGKPQAAAPPPPEPAAPQIDGPPPPSRQTGLDPAPVPNTNVQRPYADRLPRADWDLGVPSRPDPYQGQTFERRDPAPDRRSPPGAWYPSPGASVRLPF